ncbi:MAG: PrsW family intramembrane metalloprotease [Candidatus Magasanikbacteria bacterium]|nr:PrsW family intramembrane metalloprotease [Candidatus Magasanikbacteria bacterium]
MIPVFVYKYLYQHFLPELSEFRIFRPLLDSPILGGVMLFLFNLTMLSLILFMLSGTVSLLLNFFNHSSLINLKNALKQEPLCFTTVSLLLGAVIVIEKGSQTVFHSPLLGAVLGSTLFLAIIEEYIKHLLVRVTDDKKIKDIDDAITLSIVVGLAFAFIETIIYAFAAGGMKIIFFRTLVSLPIHVVASGVFGYFYGLAHFAKQMVEKEGGEKTYHTHLWGMASHGWLHRVLTLKKSTVYSEEKIAEGILLATLFHAVMNLLFEFSLGVWAVPCVVAGIAILFRLYKIGQAEYRLMIAK